MEAAPYNTTTVRIGVAARRRLKVECANRDISMLDAVNAAVEAWLRNPGAALSKQATEAPRSRPRRIAQPRRRKSA